MAEAKMDDATPNANVAPASEEAATPQVAEKAAPAPAPCRTLYLRDLDEKRKLPQLRKLLHAYFTPYGEVEWIYASRAVRLRGQAFVTFRDEACATTALKKAHGEQFLGRPLQVQYARSVTLRPQGKKATAANKGKRRAADADAGAGAGGGASAARPPKPKRQKTALPPNPILFAEKVPPGNALAERCARFAGFVEVRGVPAKPTIAFVEFASEQHAAVCMGALGGVVLVEGTEPLVLSYAKK